jgi:tetratricopeptide (TPR) repeat protein
VSATAAKGIAVMRPATVWLALAAMIGSLGLLGGCGKGGSDPADGTGATRLKQLGAARRQVFWHPRSLDARLALGQASYELRAYNDAYAAYRRAAALDPRSYAACMGMARVSAMLHDPSEALDWLRRAERIKPGGEELTELRGRMLLLAGRLDDAIAVLRKATQVQPKKVSNWLNLASAYSVLGQQPQAVAQARRAVSLQPGDAVARLALAMYLDKAGLPAQAEAEYRRALKSDPTNTTVMLALAQNLVDRKRHLPEARELALAAAESDADRPGAAVTAAWTLHLQGETQRGVEELGRLVNSSPQNPEAWSKLAVMLRALRDTERARGREDGARYWEGKAQEAEAYAKQFIGISEPLPAVLSPAASGP